MYEFAERTVKRHSGNKAKTKFYSQLFLVFTVEAETISNSVRKFCELQSGPAPRGGGHSGAVPPQMTACAPPSEDCAPKKLRGKGLLEGKSRPRLVFASSIFVIFVD